MATIDQPIYLTHKVRIDDLSEGEYRKNVDLSPLRSEFQDNFELFLEIHNYYDEEVESEEEESAELITIGLVLLRKNTNSPIDYAKMEYELHFANCDGDPLSPIGTLTIQLTKIDELSSTAECSLYYDQFRDFYTHLEEDSRGYNFCIIIREAEIRGVASDVSDSVVEFGPEYRELEKFSGYRKLKEIALGESGEAEGWRQATLRMKNEIVVANRMIESFPSKSEEMSARISELEDQEKVFSDRARVRDIDLNQLQSSIHDLEQKNYILDRKLKTHQVISLSDKNEVSKLIQGGDKSLTDSQIQLLICNLAILRERVLEELNESQLCLICMENRRSIVMEPCGHIAVCLSCAGDLSCQNTRSCPKCTQPYRSTTRVAY